MASFPNFWTLLFKLFSNESTKVNTVIMVKMPMEMPNKERKVLNLLTANALSANNTDSLNNLKNNIKQNYDLI